MKFNFQENIKEGLRAIKSNLLRSVLTALIIAIGITALVGILTSIDGIKKSIDNSLADLGGNSFEIRKKGKQGRRRMRGIQDVKYPDITFKEALAYKKMMGEKYSVSVSSLVTFAAELKNGSNKTNPNIYIMGGDENYLAANGYDLLKGRAFSNRELEGDMVCLVGEEIASKLYPNQNPINQPIQGYGKQFKIIGVIKNSGGVMGGNGSNRQMLIPLQTAYFNSGGKSLTYDISTLVPTGGKFRQAMGEATGLFRLIRKDPVNKPESFEVVRSESAAESLNSVAGILRSAGFGVGFITLLGAAIGLMNIMMVSVTERTREIGIRKALGATPAIIRQQFLFEAVLICLLGGFGGIILGIGIGNIVASAISDAGFIIPWMWVIMGVISCVVVGVVSGYWPAYKASRLDPIESLRFE